MTSIKAAGPRLVEKETVITTTTVIKKKAITNTSAVTFTK